jgi:hypothetical protein
MKEQKHVSTPCEEPNRKTAVCDVEAFGTLLAAKRYWLLVSPLRYFYGPCPPYPNEQRGCSAPLRTSPHPSILFDALFLVDRSSSPRAIAPSFPARHPAAGQVSFAQAVLVLASGRGEEPVRIGERGPAGPPPAPTADCAHSAQTRLQIGAQLSRARQICRHISIVNCSNRSAHFAEASLRTSRSPDWERSPSGRSSSRPAVACACSLLGQNSLGESDRPDIFIRRRGTLLQPSIITRKTG